MERFSVIIPWWRRPELSRTVAANAELFAQYASEVIVVDCGDEPDVLPAMLDGCVGKAPIRHILLPLPAFDTPFNKCLASNIGASRSSERLLFFLDSDIVLTPSAFTEPAAALAREPCFAQIFHVRETEPLLQPWHMAVGHQIHTRELVHHNGRRATIQSLWWGDGSRCGGGLLLMQRQHFTAVNGFNSALSGYGFEDHDLHLRLQFALGLTLASVGDVVHLSHGDDLRNIRGSHDTDQRANMSICFQNYGRGDFNGTYARDVDEWRSRIRELPLPGVSVVPRAASPLATN